MDKLQEIIRYNGSVATRAEAAEGLLTGGVPFAWVIRYLSDSPTLTPQEVQREAKPKDRVRFSDPPDRVPVTPVTPVAMDAPAPPATKPAHELTGAEFAATLPGRVTRTPAVGVHDWAKAQGRETDLEWDKIDHNTADLIGGLLTRGSRQQKGHTKALVVKLSRYNALYRDYRAAVTSGSVPQVEAVTPIAPAASEADAAYVRAAHKRSIYKALGAGLTVPPHVLAEYPGVGDRAADKRTAARGAPAQPN